MKNSEISVKELKNSQFIKTLKSKKIGLILSGGGARAAYQAGCIDIMREIGIDNFHVVAGSSAGALNSLAIANNKSNISELWKSINVHKIYSPSPLMVPYFFMSTIFAPILSLFPKKYLPYRSPTFIRPLLTGFATLLMKSANTHYSLADTTPLELNLRHFLNDGKIENKENTSCPVYVTLCRDSSWFDPDTPSVMPIRKLGVKFYDLMKPYGAGGMIPDYIRIDDKHISEAVKIACASAALPHISRRFYYNSEFYEDGGLIDNIPCSVALKYKVEVMIVLDVSRKSYRHRLSYKTSIIAQLNHCARLSRAIYLEKLPVEFFYKKYVRWLKKKWHRFRFYEAASLENDKHTTNNGFPRFVLGRHFPMTNKFKICPLQPIHVPEYWIQSTLSQDQSESLFSIFRFQRNYIEKLINLGRRDMLISLSKQQQTINMTDSDILSFDFRDI